MANIKISELLTPEIINAIASNADALKSALAYEAEEEKALGRPGDRECKKCCCPKFLKFNFFMSHVIIINKNAECQRHSGNGPC